MGAKSQKETVVYIASAYSGDIERNVELTKAYSRYAADAGAIPLNPILNLHGVLDERTDRAKAMEIDLSLLKRADELWVFGEPTAGMRREIAEAKKTGIPVRWITGEEEPDET